MPAKLDRCVKKVMAQGRKEDSAYAICNAMLKEGMADLPDDWEDHLTEAVNQWAASQAPIGESLEESPSGLQLLEAEGTPKGTEWDVLLIEAGPSKSGRLYPPEVLKEAATLFEGAPVFADHPTREEMFNRSERSVRDKVGTVREARYDRFTLAGRVFEGIRARVKIVAPWLREQLMESINLGEPEFFGFSINALVPRTRKQIDGRFMEVAESIKQVISVDVVTTPGAGGRALALLASMRDPVPPGEPEPPKDPNQPPSSEGTTMELSQEQLDELLSKAAEKAAAHAIEQLRAQAATEPPPEPKPDPEPEPKPEPAPVAVATAEPPVTVTVAGDTAGTQALAAVEALRTELRQSKLSARVTEALAGIQISQRGKDQIRNRLMDLATRRDVEDGEIRALIEERQADEAELIQERFNPTGGGHTRDHILFGDSPHEKAVKSVYAFFQRAPVDDVQPPSTIQEAYCRFHGLDSWEFDQLRYMEAFSGRYDSYLDHDRVQEALISTSWAQVFQDAMYVAMMKEFAADEYNDWRLIVSEIESVPDFRTRHWTRIGGYGNLSQVSEGAPYPLLTSPGDEEITYAIAKYGGIDDVTWEATLTDNQNRLNRIPREMALAGARTLREFVLNLATTTNPTMDYDSVALYHADHGNTDTDALSLTALNDVRVNMRSQTRFGGTDVLGSANLPKFIIVPAELEARANRILNPSDAYTFQVTDDTGTTIDPQAFRGAGMQTIVYDPLTDTNNWYAVADPRRRDTIVVGFLNGRQQPDLVVQDQAQVGSVFTADKISWRIRMLFGGDVLDHRSFYRNVVA